MAESNSADVILKILSGTQAGVEVTLPAGEYGFGTGPDDDIQLIDVSIKPQHAKLRVSPGKLELAGWKGALRTASGAVFEPGGAWQQVEPLEVVTAGTTRFALGHPSSQWDTIVEDGGEARPAPAAATGWRGGAAGLGGGSLRALAVPLLALACVLMLALWLVLGGGWGRIAGPAERSRDDLAATREALDQFPFGRAVEANQEVDGTVYVKGYVETPAERRALTAAVEKTGVPARIRLWVLQNIRSETEGLIASQRLPVTFGVTGDGVLTLEGLVLSTARANAFVDLVRDRVLGVSEVKSRIRTAATLLTEVERLAASTQIQPYVMLRVDNDLIEATGAIPAQKVDAWVGFLSSYARRFAREIPLRSYVQLQSEGGRGPPGSDQAVLLGGTAGRNETALDLARLSQGAYGLGDIFPGQMPSGQDSPGQAGRASAAQGTAGSQAAPDAARQPTVLADALAEAATGPMTRRPPRPARPETERAGADRPEAAAAAAPPPSGELIDRMRPLLDPSRTGRPGGGADERVGNRTAVPAWYLPLLTEAGGGAGAGACWNGTRIQARDALAALFWLDRLSTSEAESLARFSREQQALLLEVALNPAAAGACARTVDGAAEIAERSVYLREIGRNPAFIRFITRDLAPFALDITGVDLAKNRFVLTRPGRKLPAGSAPDPSSRVAFIGELGLGVQLKSGLAAVIFDPEINWKITQ